MKAVVTGASGHLGRSVVSAFAAAGYEVVAGTRSGRLPEAPFGALPARGVRAFALDLDRDSAVEALRGELAGECVLVHLAAWHPPATAATGPEERKRLLATNVFGTMRALDAARGSGVRAVLYASSFEVYGRVSAVPVLETTRWSPITDYGATKLAGEDHLFAFAFEEKRRVVALRFPAIYGAGETTPRALPNFLKSVARGETPAVHGDGEDLRDQIHVRDAARAFVCAAERDVSGIFNVADGKPHSIRELATLALRVAGLEGEPRHLPRQKERCDYHLSIAKARAELGFEPEVELAEGMREQLAWLRA